MKYEFSEIELGGVILPIEGYAVLEHDPREQRRHMPDIVLHGFVPGCKRPLGAELLLNTSSEACLMSLNFAIRRWLWDKRLADMAGQWDAEAPERRLAAQHDAEKFQASSYA